MIVVKILLVSDREVPYIWDHFDPERFKGVELILSAGDLNPKYLSFLVTMIHAPLYYIPGNHNESYIKTPPDGCECIDGQIITYKGIRIMGLGGSMKYNCGAYQYTDKQMNKRIRKLRFKLWKNKGIDILLTHAPAYALGDGEDLCHRGFTAFTDLMDKHNPKYFIHGHQHLNYKRQERIQQYKDTTIINAYEYYIVEYK